MGLAEIARNNPCSADPAWSKSSLVEKVSGPIETLSPFNCACKPMPRSAMVRSSATMMASMRGTIRSTPSASVSSMMK